MSAAAHGGDVVAVAIAGRRSQRAVRWAKENLIPCASRVLLLHVIPPMSPDLTASPVSSPPAAAAATPLFSSLTSYLSLNSANSSAHTSENGESGREMVTVAESRRDVAVDRRERKRAALEPFRTICKSDKEVEIEVLEAEDVAGAILQFTTENGVKNLVLGCASLPWLNRIIKSQDVPNAVLESATGTCNVFLVSRRKIILKLATDSITNGFSPTMHIKKMKSNLLTMGERGIRTPRSISLPLGSTYPEPSDHRRMDSLASNDGFHFSDSFENNNLALVLPSMWEEQYSNEGSFNNSHPDIQRSHTHPLVFPNINSNAEQSITEADAKEVERLRTKLHDAVLIYDRSCKKLAFVRMKVESIASKRSEGEMKLSEAIQREEEARRIADEEKARRIEADKEVDEAKKLLVKEALDRHIAEINAIKESSEKSKIMDSLFAGENLCRSYSSFEVEVATNNFSETMKIGEGGYGNVYKCYLDQIPVAIKVLRKDMIEKTTNVQFLREVEVLTRIRHPHVVLLLGVCAENGCLVYEYMENGSLDDRLYRKDGTKPLPWATRFRILFEVACTLAFLHGSTPHAIIHRDLKPGNILLDRNYVSKISDVGLARLISDVVPDDLTEYRDTDITGTPHYIDPEYHRTGTLRPKSDLYAFGIIALQMLTGRHPLGLVGDAENALNSGTFSTMLDDSVKGWPLEESEKLAQTALKCTALRCRERPDLETEVLPVLEQIMNSLDARLKTKELETLAPSQYYCPILKEVMTDPYIAADGFTYEHRAIESWLAKHDVSPMTHLKLPNTSILPNLTMRHAIQEWKGQSMLPNALGNQLDEA